MAAQNDDDDNDQYSSVDKNTALTYIARTEAAMKEKSYTSRGAAYHGYRQLWLYRIRTKTISPLAVGAESAPYIP